MAQPSVDWQPAADREFLTRNCAGCHNQRLKTAGLALDDAGFVAGRRGRRRRGKRWCGSFGPARCLRPAGRGPTGGDHGLRRVARSRARPGGGARRPIPGRPTVHRLNRAEYANAIRDLLALDIDGRALLPADDADEHGFDNIADVLSVSPALLERYMSAAQKDQPPGARAAAAAVRRSQTYDVPRLLVQDDRDERRPSVRLARRHRDPPLLSGRRRIHRSRSSCRRTCTTTSAASAGRISSRCGVDGARVALFTVGGEDQATPAPASFAGAIFGSRSGKSYAHDADATLEARFAAKAGTRVVGVSFVDEPSPAPEGVLQPRQVGLSAGHR